MANVTGSTPIWLCVVLIVGACATVVILIKNPFRIARGELTPQMRADAIAKLKDPFFSSVLDPTVPEFVFQQVKDIAILKVAALRAMETKSAQFVGFSGTVVAAVGIFGKDVAVPLMGAIVALLLGGTICSVIAVWVHSTYVPTPALYNSSAVPSDNETRARIAMALAESFSEYSLDVQRTAAVKDAGSKLA
jgi:hypothetical protein